MYTRNARVKHGFLSHSFFETFKAILLSGLTCLLGLFLLASMPAFGQDSEGTIQGQITDAETGEPVPGVNVIVTDVSTTVGAATNNQGQYEIEGVPAGERTLEARFVGYDTESRTVEVIEGETVTVNFELGTTEVGLEEVVVTGAGVTTEKRQLGQTVSTVDTEDIEEVSANSVSEVLQGRVPGLVANSLGEVGAASPIRIRGTVSLTQRNSPLVYIDGVRVGSQQREFASITTSPLDHINPQDIDRVEVLKGAAAATLYGTEASSGVIQIFTKRGAEGTDRWSFSTSQRFTQTPLDQIPPNAAYDADAGEVLTNSPAEDHVGTGYEQEYNLSLRGGGGEFSYYGSGWYKNSDGSLPTNGLENLGARLNLTSRHIEDLNMRLSANVINNEVKVPYPSWGLMGEFVLADPRRVSEARPYGELFHTVPGVLAYDNTRETSRYTISGDLNYQWTDGLSSNLQVGYHRASNRNQISVPPGPDVRNPTGWRQIRNGSHTEITLDLSSAWETNITDNVTSTLTTGGQSFWEFKNENVSAVQDFPGSAISTLRGASTVTNVDEEFKEVVNAGVFVQEEVGINDRLFVTGGIRVDGNSAFGENFGLQPYPRVGVSWVISDEPFWGADVFDPLRLRAALGTSGLQPGVYDALRTWRVKALLNNDPVVTPEAPGNQDLKPEQSREIEVGANMGLFDGRLTLDATYFWQRTTDAILAFDDAPSKGFLAPKLRNIGELRSHGLESSASFTAVDNSNVRWDLDATLSTNNQTVEELGRVPSFQTSGDTRVWNTIKEGRQPGAVIAPVLDPDDPYDLTVPVEDLENLTEIEPNFKQTEDGRRAREFIGNQFPTITGSFGTTVGLPEYNLRLKTRLRAEGGFVVFDETNLIRASVNITPETAQMLKELDDPNTSTERRREIAEEYTQINPEVHSNWVEDGDYLRLQEVSLSWDIPASITRSLSVDNATLTVAGRNLALFTKYGGIIDPGTTSSAENDFAANVDYFGAPSPRRFEVKFNMSF